MGDCKVQSVKAWLLVNGICNVHDRGNRYVLKFMAMSYRYMQIARLQGNGISVKMRDAHLTLCIKGEIAG